MAQTKTKSVDAKITCIVVVKGDCIAIEFDGATVLLQAAWVEEGKARLDIYHPKPVTAVNCGLARIVAIANGA